jgi:hypothetical protein
MRFWLGLFFSNRECHKHAFNEVFVVALFSIFPLVLLPFIASLKSAAEAPFDPISTLWAAISAGQLYLYSFAMFGMIIWLCVEDVTKKPFAPRVYFVVAAVLPAFLCLLVYGSDPGLSKPLNPLVVRISVWIYCGYLLIYYALLVFKLVRAPFFSEAVDDEVKSLIDQSRKQRGAHRD